MAGSNTSLSRAPRVWGLGAACIDILVTVRELPQSGSKIRSERCIRQGGGNAANTMTALSRLGVRTCMLTKIGSDANGDEVIQGLENELVSTQYIVHYDGPTAFSYVIVEELFPTRTCIHTYAEEILEPENLPECGALQAEEVDLVHLDSRMTKAAIELAKRAQSQNIPVTLDVEKDRPHLADLLPLVDYIITKTDFILKYTGAVNFLDGMVKLLQSCQKVKAIITTLGGEGSVALFRNGLLWPGSSQTTAELEVYNQDLDLCIFRSSAHPLPKGVQIVDTTGAGDAYIGGFIKGILSHLTINKAMTLAGYVATQSILRLGARGGMPSLEDVRKEFVEL